MVLFMAFLIDNRLKSATVKTYLSAIRAVLWENKIKLNEDLWLISSLTRACKIKNDKVIATLPIHKHLLNLLLKQCVIYFGNEKGQPYLQSLYQAMFSAAYYGLLRIGEIAKRPHVILADDVHIAENKQKMLFMLKTSKTRGRGDKPQKIKITSTPVTKGLKGLKSARLQDFCPYSILNSYILIRPNARSASEQFFVFSDNSVVHPNH